MLNRAALPRTFGGALHAFVLQLVLGCSQCILGLGEVASLVYLPAELRCSCSRSTVGRGESRRLLSSTIASTSGAITRSVFFMARSVLSNARLTTE